MHVFATHLLTRCRCASVETKARHQQLPPFSHRPKAGLHVGERESLWRHGQMRGGARQETADGLPCAAQSHDERQEERQGDERDGRDGKQGAVLRRARCRVCVLGEAAQEVGLCREPDGVHCRDPAPQHKPKEVPVVVTTNAVGSEDAVVILLAAPPARKRNDQVLRSDIVHRLFDRVCSGRSVSAHVSSHAHAHVSHSHNVDARTATQNACVHTNARREMTEAKSCTCCIGGSDDPPHPCGSSLQALNVNLRHQG